MTVLPALAVATATATPLEVELARELSLQVRRAEVAEARLDACRDRAAPEPPEWVAPVVGAALGIAAGAVVAVVVD